ncbi:MAG: UbiA prenyltransferase family protein [Pseudomonadales bacterium]|nr:UbiA prenyltransferase family protein [Pseudomonadales bacterium]
MNTITYIPDLKVFFVAIRVKQWIKNLIVPVVGIAALNSQSDLYQQISNLAIAFFAFCIASSSIYLINDMMDKEKDRAHPRKRHRPIASGKISESFVYSLLAISMPTSLAMAYHCNIEAMGLLLAYLVINVGYCLKLKNIPQVDIICVASGFTLRALTGALAVGQNIDFWLLGTITFSCMALAIMKRMKELKQLGSSGETRAVLQGYTYEALAKIHDMFLIMSVLATTIYIGNLEIENPILKGLGLTALSSVFLVLVQKIQQNENGDPTEFFYRNKFISGAILVLVVFLLMFSLDNG